MRTERFGYAIRDLTVANVMARQADRHGDKVYLRFLPDRREYSYREVESITNRIANGLLVMGNRPGQHFAMLMENCPEALFLLLAVAKMGGVSAPINAAARGAQLRYFIDLFDAETITVETALLDRVIEILPDCSQVRSVVIVREDPDLPLPELPQVEGIRFIHFEDLAMAPDTMVPVETRFTDLAMLAFTSGTTGPSKGNMQTSARFLLNPIANCEAVGAQENDVFYTALPVFHTNALQVTLMPALLCGGTAVLSRRFSASNFWRELCENDVTLVVMLGSMSNILWGRAPDPQDRRHKLRIVSASPMPRFHEAFEERFGVKLMSGYGLTDFGAPTSLPLDAPADKKLSCGRAREGWQVRIVDDDDFDMPTGEVGEIVLRTDNVWEASLGYYKMPEKTLEALRNGWWHTGDRGYLDADGYLWFVDRKKDALRRRGENISAFEVEQGIQSHPDVAEAVVFPVKSEMSEDEVAAAVVLREGSSLTEVDLISHCRANMAYFMVPRYLRFMDEVPRTLTQKVQKFRLKEEADADPSILWDREAHGIVIGRERQHT